MGQLVFQATLGGQVNLVGPNTASTFNINVPAVAGNMVTTGDTGTVTNTMLAGSIANAKLTNSSVTIGSTNVALGDTASTVAGLTLTTPNIGTPSAGTLTNCTGLPAATGLTGVVSQINGGTGTTTGYYGFKNRIINGAMMIDQRNAGASVTVTTANQYTVDRWQAFATQSSKYTAQQNAGSVTLPVGFTNYLGLTSSSAYSVTSSDYFFVRQGIEGFNTADLAWGTANAQAVTLSFKVYSSLTGTFGGAVGNSSGNRSYPFSFTVSSANTWTTVSVTIAGDTTGTWLTTNGGGIYVYFGLGVGSTYSGTAGSWSGSNYFSATGATSVVGTSGATFYITGVQLEKGSTATSFDYRPYGTELALCQRYLPAYNYSAAAALCNGANYTSSSVLAVIPLKVSARTAPTGITISSGSVLTSYSGGSAYTSSAVSFNNASTESVGISITISGATQGHGSQVNFNAAGQLLFTGCEL